MPKIFLIACEASGDAHGAVLAQSLRKLDPRIEFEGLGGPEMGRSGVSLLADMTKISALGFGDVLGKYFQFRKIFYRALTHVRKTKPDLLILIDSPAFNLRFAKKIRKRVPIIYYISPQIWAWGGRRIRTIKRTIDHMMVILPFEEEIYRKAGVPCTFVGHPLLDRIKPSKSRTLLRQEFGVRETEKAIALLPGSRESEVRRILPVMLETADLLTGENPGLKFFLIEAPHVSREIYEAPLERHPQLHPFRTAERLYDVVHLADFALVASGTATLETALLGTPFFLLYKTSASTFLIGRRLVKIPYLGLVNVLAGRFVVPEFIQHLAEPQRIAHETKVLLENEVLRDKLREEIYEVTRKLGEPGATERAAKVVLGKLRESEGYRRARP
ncbi:MAG: lipid-A-disaccharide synthase [Candidatus Omnitrophica bacterium]|nr:lipid-A-disaccharide synthase [Candidatus Omnitrophota bacterium]